MDEVWFQLRTRQALFITALSEKCCYAVLKIPYGKMFDYHRFGCFREQGIKNCRGIVVPTVSSAVNKVRTCADKALDPVLTLDLRPAPQILTANPLHSIFLI